MPSDSVQTPPATLVSTEVEASREERLRVLYTSLLTELESLHQEGKILKTELQTAVDQQQMETILKTIKDS